MSEKLPIHMEAVARHLLGDPSKATKHELRFGAHGSLKINLNDGTWFDHENKSGGGVLALIEREKKLSNGAAIEWMKDELGIDVSSDSSQIVATYDYTDERGAVLFQVVRYYPKTFKQRRPDGRGDWIWSAKDVRQVPFHLPQLLEANDRTVHICEGEKDVLSLERLGLIATTNAGGAGGWRADFGQFLRGADVVIFPHNDKAGWSHAKQVAKLLRDVVARVRIVRLPNLQPKGDVSDWISAGGTVEGLAALVDGNSESPEDFESAKPEEKPDLIPILSSAEFIRGFVPPEYLVDGIIQRGSLYSFTAPTGAGKTAIALRVLASIALGRAIGMHDVRQGRAVMFVGENPDDVRARWIGLSEHMGFDAEVIDVHFVPGIFAIPDIAACLREKTAKIGDITMVAVDTGAAYFGGEQENDNKELGDYARTLRTLTGLPGRPGVIVNCHPVKNASADNLIPRGGGAFLAEVDGNLCGTKTDLVVEMHWQGKFRGPDFAPIPFELVTVTSDRLVDSRGRKMPTVITRTISQTEQAGKEDDVTHELEKLLKVMADGGGTMSVADMAKAAGWVSAGGVPNKAKVFRLLIILAKQNLVSKYLNTWVLSGKGLKTKNGH